MTTSARSAIRSVTFPFPSSPHWAPTTTSPGISTPHQSGSSLFGGTVRRHAAEIPLPVHVGELRIAGQESEHDLTHGTVPVLGDDDVGLARPFGVAVVVLVAVDEHDEVCVLLDSTAFAKVRQQRLPAVIRIRARLDR